MDGVPNSEDVLMSLFMWASASRARLNLSDEELWTAAVKTAESTSC